MLALLFGFYKLNLAPLSVRLKVFVFDLVGAFRKVLYVAQESDSPGPSGLKLLARETLHQQAL